MTRQQPSSAAAGTPVPAAAVGTLVAVVGLGAFRVMYRNFYDTLGIGVDEVGLSTWQMATAAIAGWLALLAAAFPTALVGIMLRHVLRQREVVSASWIGLAAAAAVLYSSLEALALDNSLTSAVLTLTGTALVGAASMVTLWRRDLLSRWPVRQAATTTLGLTAFGMVSMWTAGYSAAGDAARTLGPDGNVAQGNWALTVLDIQRSPVCAIPTDANALPGLELRVDLLLLGSANSTVLLLEADQNRTVHRIPAALVVTKTRSSKTCA